MSATPQRQVRLSDDDWYPSVAAAKAAGLGIADVIARLLRAWRAGEIQLPDTDPRMPRTVDPCPTCGTEVTAVESPYPGQTYALPCLHRVLVTMWPDRVELARGES